MYTVLITSDNELVTTVEENIMQKSKMVDKIHFITAPTYKGVDMSNFTVNLEYILPISRTYRSRRLTKSAKNYVDSFGNEWLEYVIDFDTDITAEFGDVTLQISFINVSYNETTGETIQQVRKTESTTIKISPIDTWSDIVADKNLTALDQETVKLVALGNYIKEMENRIYNEKADGISYTDGELQLTSNGNKIGNSVAVGETVTIEQNELKVVTF